MSASFHSKVSSLEAIINSIEYDQKVCRWFTYLIVQPTVKSKFVTEKDMVNLYKKLKNVVTLQRISFTTFLIFLLLIALKSNYLYLLFGIIFTIVFIKLHKIKKDCVKKIIQHILVTDIKKQILTQKTLYQICEEYSQKFNIPSLVDTIVAFDNISRKTITYVFLIFCFLYPIVFWQSFLYVIISYFVINAALNTNLLYKHLK